MNKYLEKVAAQAKKKKPLQTKPASSIAKYKSVSKRKVKAKDSDFHKPNKYLTKAAEIVHRGHTFPGYNKPIDAPEGDKHKKIVLAKSGDIVKVVKFGARGYGSNYSEKARNSYLARSAKIKGADDKLSANYWAREHLWRPNSQVYEKPEKK